MIEAKANKSLNQNKEGNNISALKGKNLGLNSMRSALDTVNEEME